MNMITHQAIRQNFVSTLLFILIQRLQKHLMIFCILKDRLLVDPPQYHMIDSRFTLQPSRSWHSNHPLKINTYETIIPFFRQKEPSLSGLLFFVAFVFTCYNTTGGDTREKKNPVWHWGL
jgi:hypothetical protein